MDHWLQIARAAFDRSVSGSEAELRIQSGLGEVWWIEDSPEVHFKCFVKKLLYRRSDCRTQTAEGEGLKTADLPWAQRQTSGVLAS